MTPALIKSPSDTGTETGSSSDDPHSRGIRPLDQLTGLCIGLAALLLPLSDFGRLFNTAQSSTHAQLDRLHFSSILTSKPRWT